MPHEQDLQGLTDELAALGYPLKPPPDLGRAPQFEYVADCLLWLAQRAVPSVSVPRDYSSEQKRVDFMAEVGSQLHSATGIKLNLRRLYRGGGSCVRELQRLAATLRQAAADGNMPGKPGSQQTAQTPTQAPVASQEEDVGVRQRALQAAIAAARQQAAQLEQAITTQGQEQQMLEARIEKRHVELDRVERRLESLQAVKPAHSAEAEGLRQELGQLYQQYLHKFRNLEYLEGQLDKASAARQAEAEEADRQLRRIQRQVAAEEQRLLQGDAAPSGPPSSKANSPQAARLDSDDSEEQLQLGGWGTKALPRLGLGGVGSSATGGGGLASGKGRPQLDLQLQLLPEEDSGGGGGSGGQPSSGRSRLSASSSGRPQAGGEQGSAQPAAEGKVSFGGASLIPAHRGSGSSGGGAALRPGSARRTTGSGNALQRKGKNTGGMGGGEDVEQEGATMRRVSFQHVSQGGNDF